MESEILLSMFGKILEAETALYWHKVLTLESIRAICMDGSLHRSVFSTFDGNKHSDVFKETIQSVVAMLFEEKKGLLTGLPISAGGAADVKESKDSGECSFYWAESGIKVPWYVVFYFCVYILT